MSKLADLLLRVPAPGRATYPEPDDEDEDEERQRRLRELLAARGGQGQPAPKTPPPPRRRLSPGERAGFLCLAALALALAVPGWLRGALYTVEGWAVLVRAMLGLVQLPATVALPGGWPLVGLVLGVGLLYSFAELGARPRRAWLAWGAGLLALAVAVWLLVIGTDIASTVIGVLNTPEAAPAYERWIAERPAAAAIYGVTLTFYPEALTVLAGYLVRQARGG